jgi:MYXO-CTERM domain-containing protein
LLFSIVCGGVSACNRDDGDNRIGEARSAIMISAPAALRPLAPDSRASDQFGVGLGVSGSTAVICANDSVTAVAGGAFVFQKSGDTWSQVAKLAVPDDSRPVDWCENATISGGRIAVTSLSGDGTGNGGGVYTFVGSGSTWTFEDRIPQPEIEFGQSLALSGDTLVASNFGKAWVYTRASGDWANQATLETSMPNGADVGEFGWAVALDGDRVAVGAPYEDVGGVLDAGAVYVFERTGSTWSAPTRLVAPDPMISDNLGTSLALQGDTLVAGAFFNAGGGSPAPFRSGRVFVFVRQGSTWQSQSFTGLDRTAGQTVAIDGRRIIYGSSGEVSSSIGAVHILERTNGVWAEVQDLKSGLTIDTDFGWKVGLMPDGLIAGAPTFFGVPGQLGTTVRIPGTAYAYGLNRLLKENAATCASSSECESAFCVDGVCCATACGGGAQSDCQACSRAAGGTQDGMCTALEASMAGTVTCRPSAGPCDVAEVCASSSTSCPIDSYALDGTSCDDGMVCNGVSTCQGGACHAGPPPSCPDDDDPCTTAGCTELHGCTQIVVPNCVPPVPDAGPVDAGSANSGVGGDQGMGGAGIGGASGAAGAAGTGGGVMLGNGGCNCAAGGTAPRSTLIGGLAVLGVLWTARRRSRRR